MIKVKEGTKTISMEEIKQCIFELEDGRVLSIRIKEDDNGSEKFYFWGGGDDEIHLKGDWVNASHYKHEYQNDEEKELIEKLSDRMIMEDLFDGQEVELDDQVDDISLDDLLSGS